MFIEILMVLGLLLALLVAGQLCLLAFSFAGRFVDDAKRRRLEREILGEQLEAARLQRRKQEKLVLPWHGNRKFRVERKTPECRDVVSIYLTAHDKKPLPEFQPGQCLTFELDVPGRQKRLVRCYSLSDRPRQDCYRVTVKLIKAPPDNAAAPPGLGSNFFHHHLKEGDIVDVRAPSGGFHLDPNRPFPVVLIAGGIGVTPLLSILNEIVETGSKQETWFFFGARNRTEQAFKEQIEKIARENANVRLHVGYSQAGPDDVLGRDYQYAGRLSVNLLKKVLPSNNYDFYLCCPSGMMEDLNEGLKAWGVPEKKIHTEAFGAASVKGTASVDEAGSAAVELAVHFSRSNKKLLWKGHVESILDLAAAGNIAIDSGCRAGNCGTCKVAIKSGQVRYLKEPGYTVEAGTCLACCCVPATEIVLDA
jgi:ferredoxin-NADP reductase